MTIPKFLEHLPEEQLYQMCAIALQFHTTTQLHSYYEDDGLFIHSEEKCPQCFCRWIVNKQHNIDDVNIDY